MSSEQEHLRAAITALEQQRAALGDAVVESLLAPARARLAALTSEPAVVPEQTLRQVSILFLDVVGSTQLSQHLDPEEIYTVMDRALADCSRLVQAHHGRVLQYAGDSLLGVFGADAAREDDAEHAVRCGLALLECGRALAGQVLAAHGHTGCNVRVGIHTGSVLLGGGVAASGNIRGMAVNIAARMEQTAPAGAVRISQDTFTQVRGLFEVAAQESLRVKGVDAPVSSYLVLHAKSRPVRSATRGIEGLPTRMIGRELEFGLLQDAFGLLFQKPTLVAITVVADAGIGKSRLLHEFELWAQTQDRKFHLFRGSATPQTQDQPYGLLRDILAWYCQIADHDPPASARAKLHTAIAPLFVHDDGPDQAESHVHLLGHLVGIEWTGSRHLRTILDDPRQVRNRAFHAAAQLLRRVSTADGAPLVLLLEDLHWADSESLDFLDYMKQVNRDLPMLLLGLCRPGLMERRPDWLGTPRLHQRIDLTPLDRTGSRQLADELLRKLTEIPAALREHITAGSEGNPFYMEELVRMLLDQGTIHAADGRWTLNDSRLLLNQVPPTLTAVLQARLDALPAAEKLVLQQASVIGPVFWDQALTALDPSAASLLPALQQRDLVQRRANAPADGLGEYAFKHHILYQVTYATVLKGTQRELHGRLAHWMTGHSLFRTNEFLGIAAEHFEQAGDTANAAEFHTRAAEHARARLAHEAVLRHVARGLHLLGPTSSADARHLRWRLLEVREHTLELQGERAGQRADIESLEQLAEDLDDDRRRAHAFNRRSVLASRLADYANAESSARQAMACAARAGDHELRLRGQRMVAINMARLGQVAQGLALAEATIAEARALGLRLAEALCLNTLSSLAATRDDQVGFFELAQQTMAFALDMNDGRPDPHALTNLGAARLGLGELIQSRKELEEGLRLLRASGNQAGGCAALCRLASLSLWQGDDAQALAMAHRAVEQALAVQARDFEVVALCLLGDAELALGRHLAATQAFEQAQVLAVELELAYRFDAAAGLGRVALDLGDTNAALQAIDPVLMHTATGGSLHGAESPLLVQWTCHQVLARARDPRAIAWLEQAHHAIQATAARITDTQLRHAYLTNIPHHRAIVAAWAAR